MKRSSTYFPSYDVAKTVQRSPQPERSASLSHRRSQSATFLSQQTFAKLNQIKESGKNDFAKTKKTVFDSEVSLQGSISQNFFA
jgi:hypothetical protein